VPVLLKLPEKPPPFLPKFSSPLRSTALTARVGRVLGICFGICFVTGLLSHYQYQPWSWLPEPSAPLWGYRITQGLHVLTGTASIPLLLVKLWSVFPKLFQWPPARSLVKLAERLSIAILVSSALVELFTGFFNVLDWYPWPWDFVPVHRFLAYVLIGSILLHIAVKLPDIKYGLQTKVAEGDVLTEIPWEENPNAYSNNHNTHVAPPVPEGISRRGVLVATGTGVGLLVATAAGQTVTPLAPIGLFATRQSKKGPLGVPVNRTADQAGIMKAATAPDYELTVSGPIASYTMSVATLEKLADTDESFPISCVEGWSVGAEWRGLKLIDVIRSVGGTTGSRVRVTSLEQSGSYNVSYVDGPQVARALLATHLNGERINLDHGYPLRLISPDRAGVLNTKWLSKVEVV
jgi:hypothetical protein